MKFNQIWCVSYWHEWGVQRSFFFLAPPLGALGRGEKVKYHLISITKSISKIFIPNFVCVLTNKRYKTYQTGFLFCPLGHAPGVGLWGTGGAQGGKKIFFSNMVMWYIKLTGMTSRTECKLNFHPRVKLVTLWWGQRSNIIKFMLPCQFQIFLYQTLCMFSQMKDTKHIRQDFYSAVWVMPQGWDFGALGVPRGSNNFFFKHGHVAYQIDGNDEQNKQNKCK